MLGAHREWQALYAIFKSFPRRYSRDELNVSQEQYWARRLQRQAVQDLNATGRVGQGNQDALRMIGRPIDPPMERVPAVERRFLECGRTRLVVVVPTLLDRTQIERDGLTCLQGWGPPRTFEQQTHVVTGRPVADAYNEGARFALEQSADFVLCVEDDHIIPPGTFERLWALFEATGPRCVVGAWYPQKCEPRVGAPIVLRDGRRRYLSDDGEVHEAYSVPQGFTLIPTALFREALQPWFATTACLTQDSYFSQVAREAGYRLLVDTAARIKHVCRQTGRIYE